jgi:uncharacterized protein (TIGR03067 family)
MLATFVVLALSAVDAAPIALAARPAEPPKEKEKELTEAAKKDLKKLEGVWKPVKGIKDGVEETDDEDVALEFKGRTLLVKDMEFLEITGLDTTTDPKLIDFKTVADRGPLKKGTVFEGIYKLDGDTLTLALYEEGGTNRPTKFESAKGSKVILITFERQKK